MSSPTRRTYDVRRRILSKSQRNERLGFVIVLLVIALSIIFLQSGDVIFNFLFR